MISGKRHCCCIFHIFFGLFFEFLSGPIILERKRVNGLKGTTGKRKAEPWKMEKASPFLYTLNHFYT